MPTVFLYGRRWYCVFLTLLLPLYVTSRPELPPFDGDCNRRLSREAVIIIENDVYTEANLVNVELVPECRWNLEKNRYGQQELQKKEMKYGTWECSICRKQFRTEWFIDLHMHSKHTAYDTYLNPPPSSSISPGVINPADPKNNNENNNNGICFADYCGILGCPSLQYNESMEHDHDDPSLMKDKNKEEDNQDEEVDEEEGETNDKNNNTSSTLFSSSTDTKDDQNPEQNTATINEYSIANLTSIQELKHKDQYSSLLTKKQQRERDRCSAIIVGCLPLPRNLVNGSWIRNNTTTYSENNDTDTAGSLDTTVDDKDNNNNKYLRTQRTLTIEQQQQLMIQRTYEFRHKLIRDFCDNSYTVKREKAIQTIYKDNGTSVLWYIFGLTILIMVIFYGLMYLMDINSDENNNSSSTSVHRVRKTAVSSSQSYRYRHHNVVNPDNPTKINRLSTTDGGYYPPHTKYGNAAIPDTTNTTTTVHNNQRDYPQPSQQSQESSYSSSIKTTNTSTHMVNRRNKEIITVRTVGGENDSYRTSSSSSLSSSSSSSSPSYYNPNYSNNVPYSVSPSYYQMEDHVGQH